MLSALLSAAYIREQSDVDEKADNYIAMNGGKGCVVQSSVNGW